MEPTYTTDQMKLASALFSKEKEAMTIYPLPTVTGSSIRKEFSFFGPGMNYTAWADAYERSQLPVDAKTLFEAFEYFRSRVKPPRTN